MFRGKSHFHSLHAFARTVLWTNLVLTRRKSFLHIACMCKPGSTTTVLPVHILFTGIINGIWVAVPPIYWKLHNVLLRCTLRAATFWMSVRYTRYIFSIHKCVHFTTGWKPPSPYHIHFCQMDGYHWFRLFSSRHHHLRHDMFTWVRGFAQFCWKRLPETLVARISWLYHFPTIAHSGDCYFRRMAEIIICTQKHAFYFAFRRHLLR